MSAESFERTHTWSYAELLGEITRAANMFGALSVTGDAPVAFVLPDLPETHFTIWGGEAVGVAFAVNPLLEPSHIAELLRAARARMLVTLAPTRCRTTFGCASRRTLPRSPTFAWLRGSIWRLTSTKKARTDAWAVGSMLGPASSPRTFSCGLPLFHVNAQLVTGLLPWMNGDHVVIGTPEGYRGKGASPDSGNSYRTTA
jgi:acyl-CoA synthetase (AMP-forming)/AMP-acid ligase II